MVVREPGRLAGLLIALSSAVVLCCGGETKARQGPEFEPPPIEDAPSAPAEEDAGADAAPDDSASQAQVMQGIDAVQKKDFERAKTLLADARKRDPKDARVAYYLGVALENTGDAPAAKAEYRAALELDATLADAGAAMSRLLLADKDASGALTTAEAGLKTSPQHVELLLVRARALDALGKKPEAVKAFADVVQLRPEDANLRLLYADQLIAAGESKQALEQLRSAANTSDPALLIALSERFAALKAAADCKAALDKVMAGKDDPDLKKRKGACSKPPKK